MPQNFEQQPSFSGPQRGVPYGFNTGNMYSNVPPGSQQPLGNVFGQPIVQDMALQYGQQVWTYVFLIGFVLSLFIISFSWRVQEKLWCSKI